MAGSNAGSNPVGRPTILDDLTLKKLEEAFAYGASDVEACFYADISHQTLYNYQKKHPEFVERKAALKQNPILVARKKVVEELATDVVTARWYLERKQKSEFAARTELTGDGGGPAKIEVITRRRTGDKKVVTNEPNETDD